MREDDADRKMAPKPAHIVGEALDSLSVHELEERVGLLEAEIARLQAAAARKLASRSAADAFFKPG